jgi:hypothetical protein
MNFNVQFLSEAGAGGKPRVLRTVTFEGDDLYAVVSRTRIILSLRSYEPSFQGFQIVSSEGRVLHQERREEVEAGTPDPSSAPRALHKDAEPAQPRAE